MPNLNKVMLMGHLTRAPELNTTPKGTSNCKFGLAVNREWRNDAGDAQSEVLFIDLEAWGKTAETIAKYLTKGAPIYVEGRLKLDQWEDKKTNEKRSRIKVVVDQFQFLPSSDRKAEAPAAPGAQSPAEKPAQATSYAAAVKRAANEEEQIPF